MNKKEIKLRTSGELITQIEIIAERLLAYEITYQQARNAALERKLKTEISRENRELSEIRAELLSRCTPKPEPIAAPATEDTPPPKKVRKKAPKPVPEIGGVHAPSAPHKRIPARRK